MVVDHTNLVKNVSAVVADLNSKKEDKVVAVVDATSQALGDRSKILVVSQGTNPEGMNLIMQRTVLKLIFYVFQPIGHV